MTMMLAVMVFNLDTPLRESLGVFVGKARL